MLHAFEDLHGDAIDATDGLIGHVVDAYFDDVYWAIRYLVVKTGSWLHAREVLLSPISLGELHLAPHTVSARLTKFKVEHSPSIDLHRPVSRQHETLFNAYYGWSPYWEGDGMWARWRTPMMMATSPPPEDRNHVVEQDGDPHLRSIREITGYHLHASDAKIGHVADFIVDDESWAIRYLVVNTSDWGFGHDVLIAPEWIKTLHVETRTIEVLVPRDVITDSPIWDPDAPITRAYEDSLRAHYLVRQARSRDSEFSEIPIETRSTVERSGPSS